MWLDKLVSSLKERLQCDARQAGIEKESETASDVLLDSRLEVVGLRVFRLHTLYNL